MKKACEILDIAPLSTFSEITKKYKQKAKEIHSDVGGSDEKMQQLNEAYEIVKSYIQNYKFSFSEEEISRQFPEDFMRKFRI